MVHYSFHKLFMRELYILQEKKKRLPNLKIHGTGHTFETIQIVIKIALLFSYSINFIEVTTLKRGPP